MDTRWSKALRLLVSPIARLATMLVALSVLAIAVATQSASIAVAGASAYLASSMIELVDLYYAARAHRAGDQVRAADREVHPRIAVIARWIGWVILFGGLLACLDGGRRHTGRFLVAGLIIWGGSLMLYGISGIILREVGGVPLRMGYGGWESIRFTKRDRRRH